VQFRETLSRRNMGIC